MGELKNFVTKLHRSTQRDYLARMLDSKVECMAVAKEYDKDYWDGERRYGYGGYRYIPDRWKPVAETLIEEYNLTSGSSVIDLGCGKGFLLYEMKLLIPDLKITGVDFSSYGLAHAKDKVKPYLFKHDLREVLPFNDNEFDLAISLGTFHNFKLFELKVALSEIQRISKQAYLMLESYRNEKEMFNLQCWALTAESFFDVDEWVWLYNHFGYKGDYEFIFFE